MSERDPGAGASPGDEQPLDSWKEIARYLRRSVRTVQNWEKSEGLPVHRHLHRKAGTVYAYPSEIDRWRQERDLLANGATVPGRRRPSRRWVALAVVAAAALAALSWRLLDGPSSGDEAAPPQQDAKRDWLLIASFDNLTGEELLDGTVEAALRRELAGFVKLAPEERLEDALRLLGRPPDVAIDGDLVREIARRDSGIRAVLTGRVEGDDLSWHLSVDLLDAVDGAPLASLSEVAHGQETLLPAVSRISHRVRERLVGDLQGIAAAVSPESAQSASLQAIRLHSLADRQLRLAGERADRTAEQLLRQALDEDPDYAPARVLFAWTLARLNRRRSEYLAEADRALELADRASAVERYFIVASRHHLRWLDAREGPDAEAAAASYRALLELDPGHYWARFNLWELLNRAGLNHEALAVGLRSLAARPDDIRTLSQVAYQLVVTVGDLEQARTYVERAKELQQELGAGTAPAEALLEFFYPHELWVRGDVEDAVREVDRIVDGLVPRTPAETRNLTHLALEAVFFYTDLGMFGKAESLQRLYGVAPPAGWEELLAWRRYDEELIAAQRRERAVSASPARIADTAWDLAMIGRLAEAEAQLESLPENLPETARAYALATRGTLALAAGRYREAISELEASLSLRPPGNGPFRAARTLARAWAALGEPEQGLPILEHASRQKPKIWHGRNYWLEVQLDLAGLYRQLGRTAEAQAIEEELRRTCARADPDYPILAALEGRRPLPPPAPVSPTL